MIRRNPTLIPMSDGDVRDVRDMVPKELEIMRSLTEGRVQAVTLVEMKTSLEPGVSNNTFESSHFKYKSHRKVLSQFCITHRIDVNKEQNKIRS
jgi:hypothetical protein